MSKPLAGKVALITGGSRGLGAATAERLSDLGADVAISYVASEEKAKAVVGSLRAKDLRALAIKSDQADPAAARPLIDKVVEHFGKLDILVNNAAVAVQGKTIDDPENDHEALNNQWMTNVVGVAALTRAAALKLSNGGRIIFVGSGAGGRVAFPGMAEYAATKAALAGYVRGAARDLGPRNITVNIVQAGMMPTDMGLSAGAKLPDSVMDTFAIRRMATLDEVTSAIAYLAGPDASYITGGALDVSGGYQA